MNATMELWVVEYSQRQGAFHVEQLVDMLRGSVSQFKDDVDGDRDYVVLGIAESHDEAHELVKKLREAREARRAAKVTPLPVASSLGR